MTELQTGDQTQKKPLPRKLILGIAIPLGVLLILGITLRIVLGALVNEQLVVDQIESALNARADVKKLNVSLFSAVSGISLEGLALGVRDDAANKALPLSERKPMKPLISLDKVELKLKFLPLLSKKLELVRFVIVSPKLTLVLSENGSNNLAPLFKTPAIVNGQPNPALTAKPEEGEEESEPTDNKPFSAKSLPISATLKEIGIDNGDVTIVMQKTAQTIRIEGLDVFINNIQIDPADLVNKNSANVEIDGVVRVISKKGGESAKILLYSNGVVVPFDKKTGEVNTMVEYQATLKQTSYVDGFAVFDQLAGSMPALNEVGLKWDKLKQKAELIRDVVVHVGYGRGRLTFLSDTKFPTKNYDLALTKGSYLITTNNQHVFNGMLLASKEESNNLLKGVDATIEKKAKGQDKAKIRSILLGDLLQGDQVALKFQSTGNISDPKVSLTSEVPGFGDIVGDLMKEGLKKGLKDKLKLPGGKEGDILNKLF